MGGYVRPIWRKQRHLADKPSLVVDEVQQFSGPGLRCAQMSKLQEMNSLKRQARFPLLIAITAAFLHVAFCIAISFGAIASDGSWKWFPVFLVDFPVSILFLPLQKFLPNEVIFGLFGTIYWFALVFGLGTLFGRLMRRKL
jgi:hypothetical protein